MPKSLQPFYQKEIEDYKSCFIAGCTLEAWRHLERAHIIGQPYSIEHTAIHAKMLAFGIANRNIKEILGQIPRLLVGGIKSWAGTIPVGNTGRANVPAWRPMPIPKDLQAIIRQAHAKL
ncbi:DUF3703 domain-containing protein [Adhaeribacter arboris]|nr:DUF3703 domain-containing protein [Adhaeribacter arboris]